MKAASAESGIEKNTATVARMLPEEDQNHDARSAAGRCAPSCSSVSIAVFTKTDWSNTTLRHQLLGHVEQMLHCGLDAIHHRDGVGVAALLQHRQVDRALAIHAHDVGLDLLRVLGVADVGDAYGRLARRS